MTVLFYDIKIKLIMDDFTVQDYADIIFIYGFCDGNSLEASREYHLRFPGRRQPNHKTFAKAFQRLRETGTPVPRKIGGPQQVNVQDEEDVIDAVIDDPTASTRRIAMNLELSQNFVWRVLHREVLHPYHFQYVQALHPGDAQRRLLFCRWLLHQTVDNVNFMSNVLWTDEATFTKDGINNRHNEHLWSLENPRAIKQRRFQQRFSVNVWGGILNNVLLDLHVMEDRLNGNLYENFLNNTILELVEDMPLHLRQRMWFQHDGAPPHRARVATAWLNAHFPVHWIGFGGPVAWPPRSPDLNPLDFYLWGHLKQLVYNVPITTREQLLERIQNAANEIRNDPNVLARVCDSLVRRCHVCIRAEGGHFEHLL